MKLFEKHLWQVWLTYLYLERNHGVPFFLLDFFLVFIAFYIMDFVKSLV